MSVAPAPGGHEVRTYVDLKSLNRVGARQGFLDYLVSIWRYRHFVLYDSRFRVGSANSQEKLGNAWIILSPLLNGLTFFLIFGLLLKTGKGIENFIGYLIIGVFLFQMSSRAISAGAQAIRANKTVIQAFNFPRATLLAAINVRELLSNIPVVITMIVMILVLPPTEAITWRILLIPPVLALQFIFNLGVGLLLARLVHHFNDLGQLISFVMRLWLYGSAVFFSIDRFESVPVIQQIMEVNPLFIVLDISRDSLLYATTPSWESWATLAVWALGAIVVGLVFFWREEERYGRDS
ncbi:ABC transporter permease [Arthrobacter roseus]|uniref:ABC transporter permease n=1 Tax=Arthrobacter roseus TaxID=136274 RepID=UPI001962C0D0|nr:ABC transporter permease [Arthrobacter roseus]MBM7848892.1 teichoic acid transport system permease protein [Arthrobacter roseus]